MDEGQQIPPHADQASREPIAKVKRTYGKKKEATDASFDTDRTIAFHHTRLEPSEATGLSGSPLSSEIRSNDASDTFGWKERLALIDKQFDEEDGLVPSRQTRKIADERLSKDSSSARSPSTEDESSGFRDDALFSASIAPLSSQSDPPSPGISRPKASWRRPSLLDSELHEAGESIDESFTARLVVQSHSTKRSEGGIEAMRSSSVNEHKRSQVGGRTPSPLRKGYDLVDETMEAKRRETSRKSGSNEKKEHSNKIKKLSKKEEKESKKAHARMMADQTVSLTKRAERYTVEHLLKSVQQRQLLPEVKLCVASSDPIQEFTSSPNANTVGVYTEMLPETESPRDQRASDDDVPDVRQQIEVDGERKQTEEDIQGKSRLAATKRRVLESRGRASAFETDDDDLEIVENVEDIKVTAAELPKTSTALEKRLAGVAGFRVGSSRHALSEGLGSSQGDSALKIAAIPVFTHRDARRPRAALDHRDLQTVMLNKATKQSMQLTREKEEEWERRGGKLVGKQHATLSTEPLSLDHLAKDLALKRLRPGQRGHAEEMERVDSDLDDDEGGEWQPRQYESMSPPPIQRDSRRPDEDEFGASAFEMESTAAHDEDVSALGDHAEATEEDEDLSRPSHHGRRMANLLVDSDSESEETQQPGRSRVLVPDTSLIMSGFGQGSEPSSEDGLDEEDKENNAPPAFDSGDDKENAVPVECAPPISFFRSRLSGVFSPEDSARHLSVSPSADENDAAQSVRKPLQARRMSDLDDPFVLRSPPSVPSPKTPKSKSPRSARSSPASIRPAFDRNGGSLTQLFDDGEGVFKDSPSVGPLQPAFRLRVNKDPPRSARPDSGTLSPEAEVIKNQSKKFICSDELSLTLDTKLQPALEVTTQIRRRADAVFEKEQDFVMKEASISPASRSKQELYISENGFLTQTRPEGSTPLVYRSWSPSRDSLVSRAPAAVLPPSTTKRLPLSTLSLDGEAISPSQQRLTRLIKGKVRTDPLVDGVQGFSPFEDQSPNAFTKMIEAARKQKKKLSKSDFVEGEAVESDEDEMFGFGRVAKRDDDEESDEDHPDAVVENLIDDAAMDAQDIGEDKVLEKVKEHLEEDDAALERYHQAAIEGKYRGKRRGGVVMDDSESDEDEDDEARRLRRRMYKKRKIQGDKLEDLKKDERSRAFYEAYQRDIQEEDTDDFSHLANDDMNEDENDADEEPESVSATEIREQLREVARQSKIGLGHHLFDPEDVTWADTFASSDDEFQVKEVDDRPKRAAMRRPVFGRADIPELDDALPRKPAKLTDEQAAQLAAWRKEQSGRNFDTGGMRGAITVTGHGSKAPRRSTGPGLKSTSVPEDNAKLPGRRKVTKSNSMLASVSDRHGCFAS